MYQSRRLKSPGLTISKRKILAIIVASLFFFTSLYVYPFYTSGDQNFYRRFYEEVTGEDLIDAFFLYRNTLGSSEPGYFLVVVMFADFIQKDVLMSFLNSALIYSLLNWANRKRVSWFVVALLALNFYLLVLLFAAERLKLAMLLLMISVNANGLKKSVLASFAFLTHTQTALLIVNWITMRALPALRGLMAGRLQKRAWRILGLLFICAALLIPMVDHMQAKFEVYEELSSGFGELLKPAVFIVLTMVYARGKRLDAFAMHLPILVAAFFVGGNRTVIFAYFVFLAYALQFRRGVNVGVLLTSTYFLVQGLQFLQNVFSYGDGFHSL